MIHIVEHINLSHKFPFLIAHQILMWTTLLLVYDFLIISFNYNRLDHFQSLDGTIMAKESI